MAVSDQLERQLARWSEAGILDGQTAARIREYESRREVPGMRWPVVFAIVFGAIMVGAGVLLFVAAHWEDLSPAQRFLIVLVMIAGFHLAAGALMPRMRSLGLALHGIGTVALGGGIFLAGQIFNLQEHWPSGILLWATGTVISFAVLRDWVQATLGALLVPAWIACEWGERTKHYGGSEKILTEFLVMVAITYLSARRGQDDSYLRRALMWAGALVILPMSAALGASGDAWNWGHRQAMPAAVHAVGLFMTFALPLLAAFFLRGKSILWNAGYAIWVYGIARLDNRNVLQNAGIYALCTLAAIGLVLWGVEEQRRERINLGVAGFALTILVFYFSEVMGKLGRSASLVGFGLLFLLGGWKLEQLRRKLVERAKGSAA